MPVVCIRTNYVLLFYAKCIEHQYWDVNTWIKTDTLTNTISITLTSIHLRLSHFKRTSYDRIYCKNMLYSINYNYDRIYCKNMLYSINYNYDRIYCKSMLYSIYYNYDRIYRKNMLCSINYKYDRIFCKKHVI